MYTTCVYRMDPLFWCFLIEVLLSIKKKKNVLWSLLYHCHAGLVKGLPLTWRLVGVR